MRRGPLLAGAVVSLACFAGFWELAEDFARSPAAVRFDLVLSVAAQSLRSPAMTALMRAITLSGGTAVVTLVCVSVVIVLWMDSHRFEAVFVALAVGGGMALSTLAKGHFGRGRPPAVDALIALPESFSFPSGHAMASLCLGVSLGYLALRSRMRPAAKTGAVSGCALYAFAVGFSRVYLGVHWPSDVLASWLLGGAWLALALGVTYSMQRSAA